MLCSNHHFCSYSNYQNVLFYLSGKTIYDFNIQYKKISQEVSDFTMMFRGLTNQTFKYGQHSLWTPPIMIFVQFIDSPPVMLYRVVINEEIFELGNDSDGSVMTNNQRSRLLLPSFAHPIYLYLVGLLLIFRLLP